MKRNETVEGSISGQLLALQVAHRGDAITGDNG